MYKRFRDSISNPRGLVQYRKDKLWFAFLYLFLFALLMGTRTFIDVATYDGLSFSYQETIRENFETVDGSCEISSGTFTCDEETSTLVYEDIGIQFFLDSHQSFEKERYDETQYAVVVHQEHIRFLFNGTMMYQQNISGFSESLMNLDFALQESNPQEFYETLNQGISNYLVSTKWMWGFGAIFVEVLLGLLLFTFFAVINSYFMYRRFMMIKFRDIFVMTTYASTALFVVLIFDQMFQFSFFITLLLIFIAFRQNSQLNDELLKRMMKHQAMMQKKKEDQFTNEKEEDIIKDDEEREYQLEEDQEETEEDEDKDKFD